MLDYPISPDFFKMFGLDHIVKLLIHYKYTVLFPIAFIEGPIISIISGFLISLHNLNPYITYGVLIAGDVAGDAGYYALGRFGGEPLVRKWGRHIGVTEATLIKAEQTLTRHGWKLYIFGKVQGLGSLILMTAGATRRPFWQYLAINTFITLFKTFLLVVIGYYFGYAYNSIDNYLSKAGIISSFIIVIILAGYYFNKKRPI
jgi:membrane protein DedA with SNARE-associated domain